MNRYEKFRNLTPNQRVLSRGDKFSLSVLPVDVALKEKIYCSLGVDAFFERISEGFQYNGYRHSQRMEHLKQKVKLP